MPYNEWYEASMSQVGGFEPYSSLINLSALEHKVKLGEEFNVIGIDWPKESMLALMKQVEPSDWPATPAGRASYDPLIDVDTIPPAPTDPSDPDVWPRRKVAFLPALPFSALDHAIALRILRGKRPARIVDFGGAFPTALTRVLLAERSIEYTLIHPRIGVAPGVPMWELDDTALAKREADMAAAAARTHALGPRDLTTQRNIERFGPRMALADVMRAAWFKRKQLPMGLEAGDIVALRSSHVSRLDSESLFFLLEVLPVLPHGVRVFVHGVWLPRHYPRELYYGLRWFATENYFLAAALSGTPRYKILFGAQAALTYSSDAVLRAALGDAAAEGVTAAAKADPTAAPSGLWLEIDATAGSKGGVPEEA